MYLILQYVNIRCRIMHIYTNKKYDMSTRRRRAAAGARTRGSSPGAIPCAARAARAPGSPPPGSRSPRCASHGEPLRSCGAKTRVESRVLVGGGGWKGRFRGDLWWLQGVFWSCLAARPRMKHSSVGSSLKAHDAPSLNRRGVFHLYMMCSG